VRCARTLVVVAVSALLLQGSRALAEPAPESKEIQTLNADIDRLYREGRVDEAIALAERTLSSQERALGPDHPGVVDSITKLALLYMAEADYAIAETLFKRVLESVKEAPGHPDSAIATATNNLGMLYWRQGNRERAGEYFDKALLIREGALGPDHPTFAVFLNNTASFYHKTGDLQRAELLYEKALAIWEKSPEPIHDQRADTLRSLASIRQSNGDHERAETLWKRALALEEEVRGADHIETAVALSNLALLYYDARDYARAEPLLERALAILENARGPDHPDVASALSNLAALQVEMGNPESAVRLYERDLEIRSKVEASEPLAVAVSLERLASLHRAQGEYARSRPYYERALEIRVKTLGAESIEAARTAKVLGTINWMLDDFTGAQPLFERALAIRKKIRGPKHPAVARAADSLASVYLVRGDHANANSLYQQALSIRQSAFEPEGPLVALSLRNLGLSNWAKADWNPAETYLARAAEIEERQISLLLPVQFEDHATAFMEGLSNTTDLILSFQRRRPNQHSATRLALTTVLRRKGRGLSTAAGESAGLRRRLGVEERVIFDKLLARRNELGHLILRGPNRSHSEALRESVKKLRREVDDLEKAAASGSSALRTWVAPVQIQDIQSRIPADTALVELVEYQDLDPAGISTDRDLGVTRLAGFVLRSAGPPSWIPLGEAAAIDTSVRAFRKALVDAEGSPKKLRERARDLYDRLAAPLQPHLKNIQTILVAPDGAAVLVPFGALVDPEGRYWVERHEIAYLTSGRDLLLSRAALPSRDPSLVVAAPDYDAERRVGSAAIEKVPARLSPEIAALHFPPIALSQTGAMDVGKLLSVTPLTGAQASDAAIEAAHAPRVLHVAVDGFFLPDPIGESTVRWSSILGVNSHSRRPVVENALLRSGLALAGANRRTNEADGGLMTALEIAGLDLWGTQLVAIAARGIESEQAAVDQSVYAFRRSLVIAGAASQFVNLWTTDHQAATELTTAYYERLLAGEGRSEALRGVQLEMLRSENRSHPFHWASFISIGERGPIAWTNAQEAAQEVSGAP
jgi:tetratricopeptide (TPR) repeat protein